MPIFTLSFLVELYDMVNVYLHHYFGMVAIHFNITRSVLRHHIRLSMWGWVIYTGLHNVDEGVFLSFFIFLIEVIWKEDGSIQL